MKTIADQYKLVTEGKLGKFQFMRNVRLTFPQFVTNVTSFGDAVKILKNKSIISEAKAAPMEYGMPNEWCDPQEYDLGMRYEIEKGTDEDKAEKIVKKNLKDNVHYYSQLHLAGYNEEAMKKGREKRTDLPTEAKENNTIDTVNGMKKVKMDALTESEIKLLANRVINDIISSK